jgi:hypothetical protein
MKAYRRFHIADIFDRIGEAEIHLSLRVTQWRQLTSNTSEQEFLWNQIFMRNRIGARVLSPDESRQREARGPNRNNKKQDVQ